jgi:hypothetical protein
MDKEEHKKKPSDNYEYLIKMGIAPQIALEIDEYTQQKEKRKKRLEKKNKKEERWK